MVYEQPSLTVDAVVFDDRGRLLLIRRKHEPFPGQYAFPGGFVDVGETVEAAALRELEEETGLKGRILTLIGVYSDPGRDPRRHTVSIAYLIEPEGTAARAGDDAATAEFVENWQDLDLAFDHNKILTDALSARKSINQGL